MRRIGAFAIAVVWLLAIGGGQADDWPHWRGPERNGVVAESSGFEAGEDDSGGDDSGGDDAGGEDAGVWPIGDPAWQRNVGAGSSSPLVVDGRLYSLGWQDGQEQVVCLAAGTGEPLWRQTYAAPLYGRHAVGDQGIYSGPSSTPEFDAETGYLYTLGSDGDLNCWDTRRGGHRVWDMNLYERFGAGRRPKVGRSGQRDYGYTSSPLVHQQWLIVEVGAPNGNLLALDKRTGKAQWLSEDDAPAGHNGGPVPITVQGVPCVAVHNFEGLLVVRLDPGHEGRTVATFPWKTEFANNIATPAVQQNSVVLTSAYNHYKIARFDVTLDGAQRVWQQDFASKVCSPVIHEGHVYWAWREVMCLDFATGQLRWKGGRLADQGSCLVTGDDRLIVWANRGDLLLVDTAQRSPNEYRERASRRQVFRRDAWPHVVLADQRLYCKDRDGNLACFAIKGGSAGPRESDDS